MTTPTHEQQLADVLRRRRELPWVGSEALAYLGGHMAQWRFLTKAFAVLAQEEMALRAAMKGEVKREIPLSPAVVVHFNSVRQHWDAQTGEWDDERYTYIGREMPSLNLRLPQSKWANPFRITHDSDEMRFLAVKDFGDWLMNQDALVSQIEELRGKMLVCWCKSDGKGHGDRRCHGDVLVELLKESER
jgi:hypothetical protein